MLRTRYFPITIVLVLLLATGCSVSPPEFDGQRAMGYLQKQVDFGSRVPGSEAWGNCRSWFYEHFNSCALAVDSQAFTFMDPYSSREIPLVNVIARHRGDPDDPRGIILVAHWDSRPRTDYHRDPTLAETTPLTGANDGASGTAILLELANLFAERPPNTNVDLLLVDGEDWGRAGDTEYYLLGARRFAQTEGNNKYYFGIVADMVGDRNLEIFREKYSQRLAPEINDLIWNAAADLGVQGFTDTVRYEIQDDHLPFNIAGVPSAVIIDFDYRYWHTDMDTPDKCSAESLAAVGKVLAYIAYNKNLWPTN